MSLDWYPAIRECCAYWPNAPMLHQTFDALETSFKNDNDACIDSAKCLVEVVCRVIIDELDDPSAPLKPKDENPAFGAWVSAAVRTLKLGDPRDTAFQKLISQHHKLTETLGSLRNGAGPVSHGKEGFIARLSSYHRRAAVLSADAIVAFLHQAYLETELNLVSTREPYEKFEKQNALIDAWCSFAGANIDEDGLEVLLRLPGDKIPIGIRVTPSQLLFSLDRFIYSEALNEAATASASKDANS